MNEVNFDTAIHYLGGVCNRQHVWQDSGQTVRYIKDGSCVLCRSIMVKAYSATTKGKESARKAITRYVASDKGKEYMQQWRTSEHGKQLQHERYLRYKATTKGQETRRRAEQKYATTDKRRISWNRKHARRHAQIAANHQAYTKDDIQCLLEMFGYACAYCGGVRSLTLDHVVPLMSGGCDAMFNLVPACRSCNSSKQDSDAFTWFSLRTSFTHERWQAIQNHVSSS